VGSLSLIIISMVLSLHALSAMEDLAITLTVESRTYMGGGVSFIISSFEKSLTRLYVHVHA
jgi:hypothetical protein